MDILCLDAAEVERLLELESLLAGLAEAFKALSSGDVSVPPRISAQVPDAGFLAAMPGYVPSMGIAVKLVSVFPRNHDRGMPSHQALIALFDPDTGTPLCVMDGTYITAFRTAAAAALSAKLLAREDARVLAIIGAGVQGAAHLRLLAQIRRFSATRVASRNHQQARRLAAEQPGASAVESFEEAVGGADVVCLSTHSGEPVVHAEWLKPGAHLTSVGYSPPQGELDPQVARRGTSSCKGASPSILRRPVAASWPASTPIPRPRSGSCCWAGGLGAALRTRSPSTSPWGTRSRMRLPRASCTERRWSRAWAGICVYRFIGSLVNFCTQLRPGTRGPIRLFPTAQTSNPSCEPP